MIEFLKRVLDPTDKLGSAVRSFVRVAGAATTTFGFNLDANQIGIIWLVIEAGIQVLVQVVPSPD